MPTCRTIAFQSRLQTMQLHSGKALMLLLAYTTTDESLRAHPLFARCTPRLRCNAQHMTCLLLLVVVVNCSVWYSRWVEWQKATTWPPTERQTAKGFLRSSMFLALLSRASVYIVVTAAGTKCMGSAFRWWQGWHTNAEIFHWLVLIALCLAGGLCGCVSQHRWRCQVGIASVDIPEKKHEHEHEHELNIN